MRKQKTLSFALALVMVFASFTVAFAGSEALSPAFVDMPDDWSTDALNKAVENDLIKGYDVNKERYIKAGNNLTRAEMAAVVNRAFGATETSNIAAVTDVPSAAWFAKDMAKSVKMKAFAYDTKMRPNDKITREEAFAVLSRVFKMTSTDANHKALDKFSDKGNISDWALKDLSGLAESGYIQGFDGKLQPKANITRAEFAVVMDNLVKQYIDSYGTIKEIATDGNVLIRTAGGTFENVTLKGDLIIADGVGEGDITLDNVKVNGRTLVRGGGVDSIIIKGGTNLGKMILAKTTGEVRIAVEAGANVDKMVVENGSDDVIVQGTVGTIEVAGDNVTVLAKEATITRGAISGTNSAIVVEKGAKINTVSISGANAKVSGEGQVYSVDIVVGGDNAAITTPNTVTKVAKNVEGVTAGGKEVPAGSTATNNATGTDSVISSGGSSSGGTKHLTLNGNNIDNFDGKVLSDSIEELVMLITEDAIFNDNVHKFSNFINFNDHRSKFEGIYWGFSLVDKDYPEDRLGWALQEMSFGISYSDDRHALIAESEALSKEIASDGGVKFKTGDVTNTLKSVAVSACGNTCIIYSHDSQLSEFADFINLYDSIKYKTLSQIADDKNGASKITVVYENGLGEEITKEYLLEYK